MKSLVESIQESMVDEGLDKLKTMSYNIKAEFDLDPYKIIKYIEDDPKSGDSLIKQYEEQDLEWDSIFRSHEWKDYIKEFTKQKSSFKNYDEILAVYSGLENLG